MVISDLAVRLIHFTIELLLQQRPPNVPVVEQDVFNTCCNERECSHRELEGTHYRTWACVW